MKIDETADLAPLLPQGPVRDRCHVMLSDPEFTSNIRAFIQRITTMPSPVILTFNIMSCIKKTAVLVLEMCSPKCELAYTYVSAGGQGRPRTLKGESTSKIRTLCAFEVKVGE